ncbi:MAG: prolipoprotein diacylglyceryl transferase [Anaerolineae bacterium]
MEPPIAFRLGPLAVHWYGIIIVASVLVAAYIASLEAKRRGQDPDHVWNALLLCLVLGIIGARLYHVFSSPRGGMAGWDYYRQNPIAILQIWHGGLAIYGAVAGGLLGVYIYARLNELSFLQWADIGTPGLILAQVIGRWGNFINQELYGYPTSLPWGITITPPYRIPPYNDLTLYPASTRFHPTFLYESLWNLLGFLLLMYVARRYSDRLLDGDVLCLYAIWYPMGRIFVEALRPDAWLIRGIAAAQIFAAIAFVVSVGTILYRHRRAGLAAELPLAEEEPSEGD